MQRRIVPRISHLKRLYCQFNQYVNLASETNLMLGGETDDPLYADVPKPCRKKSERKPYPTPIKLLIQRAKDEKQERKAQPCRLLENPPDNGLLVPELVEVAHQVYQARESLLLGLSKLLQVVPIQRCRFCLEVHVGHEGHDIRTCTGPKSGLRSARHVWTKGGVQNVVFFPKCYHLSDRVGKSRVTHDERCTVPKIPAILELCIQAGFDHPKFPTKRRTKPVYCIDGRIVDFDMMIDTGETERHSEPVIFGSLASSDVRTKIEELVNSNFENNGSSQNERRDHLGSNPKEISTKTLDSWLVMTSGVMHLMEKYSVWTCGYCPEVQVGPKGHKVRMCKAAKHQSRNGLHAWQQATIDDLVGPNYIWHVRDINGPPLGNNLKRYYGKAPAVVELCVQAGASIPDQYRSMMRLDVILPERDEVDLVA